MNLKLINDTFSGQEQGNTLTTKNITIIYSLPKDSPMKTKYNSFMIADLERDYLDAFSLPMRNLVLDLIFHEMDDKLGINLRRTLDVQLIDKLITHDSLLKRHDKNVYRQKPLLAKVKHHISKNWRSFKEAIHLYNKML